MTGRQVWTSDAFVLSAGTVLFRRSPENNELQICILHNLKTGKWNLPKGRKDRGESLEVTAVRETYEETGYPCEILPCRIPTRAPAAGARQFGSSIVDDSVEAFAMTMRPLRQPNAVKFISWYLAKLQDGSAEKVDGTQTEWEDYESIFIEADAAVERLSHIDDKQVARKAIELVRDAVVVNL